MHLNGMRPYVDPSFKGLRAQIKPNVSLKVMSLEHCIECLCTIGKKVMLYCVSYNTFTYTLYFINP